MSEPYPKTRESRRIQRWLCPFLSTTCILRRLIDISEPYSNTNGWRRFRDDCVVFRLWLRLVCCLWVRHAFKDDSLIYQSRILRRQNRDVSKGESFLVFWIIWRLLIDITVCLFPLLEEVFFEYEYRWDVFEYDSYSKATHWYIRMPIDSELRVVFEMAQCCSVWLCVASVAVCCTVIRMSCLWNEIVVPERIRFFSQCCSALQCVALSYERLMSTLWNKKVVPARIRIFCISNKSLWGGYS